MNRQATPQEALCFAAMRSIVHRLFEYFPDEDSYTCVLSDDDWIEGPHMSQLFVEALKELASEGWLSYAGMVETP